MFIDDNKALMRRMYGNLVEPSIDLPEMPKTPGKYNRSLLDNAKLPIWVRHTKKIITYYLFFPWNQFLKKKKIFFVKSIFFKLFFPASTTFIRRSFPTLRFKRSVLEGYLEDFVDGYEQFELLLQNSTLFAEFNQTAGPEELETFEALKNAKILDRPKRQAGFPGVKPSNDNK